VSEPLTQPTRGTEEEKGNNYTKLITANYSKNTHVVSTQMLALKRPPSNIMTICFRLFRYYGTLCHYFSIRGRQGRPSALDEVK